MTATPKHTNPMTTQDWRTRVPALWDATEPVASRYSICALPPDAPAAYAWVVHVLRYGPAHWAIQWGEQHLSKDGAWDFSLGSDRDDEWREQHLFDDLDRAIQLAREAALNLEIGDLHVVDAVTKAWERRHG